MSVQRCRRILPLWQLFTDIFLPISENKQIFGVYVRVCTGHLNNRLKCAKYSTTTCDAMDSFVDKLMLAKVDKWEKNNKRKCIYNKTRENPVPLNTNYIELCNSDNVDKCFSELLLRGNTQSIRSLLQKCCDDIILPSSNVLLSVMKWCSQHGDVGSVKLIQKLWKKVNIEEYKLQGGFRHYLAESLWVNGCIEEALTINHEIYKSIPHLRRELHYMLKFLISHILQKKGEAALVLLKKFCINIYKEFGNVIFLTHLWHSCFHSEWFCDNCLANDLLEEIPALRENIKSMMCPLAVQALQRHRVDIVQRLFEVMLLYNMNKEFTVVLNILFDYSCMQRDIQSCNAIIKSAKELNVVLSQVQYEKYQLLVNIREQLTPPFKKSTSLEIKPFNIKF